MLLDVVIAEDFPFLGACYGIGTLGTHQGGVVDRTLRRADRPGAGRAHRRGPRGPAARRCCPRSSRRSSATRRPCASCPGTPYTSPSSPACPVQAFRIGRNVYATQFHPELDGVGLCTRIEVYKHAGYFHPDEAESLKEMARAGDVLDPPRILQRFVELYAR